MLKAFAQQLRRADRSGQQLLPFALDRSIAALLTPVNAIHSSSSCQSPDPPTAHPPSQDAAPAGRNFDRRLNRTDRRQTIVPVARPEADPAAANRVGTIYISSTKNNTICTLVDMHARPVAWASAGTVGFKNARKSTTYAAQATAERIAQKALEQGFRRVRLVMKGIGPGKQSAVRSLCKSQVAVTELHEHTSIPHNGCRAPKKRRV